MSSKNNSAKKKSQQSEPVASASSTPSGSFESLGKTLDNLPEIQQAEAVVQAAREELLRAQQAYGEVRLQAEQKLGQIREQNIGDLISSTLHQVSKRPALGVGISLALGILIGRITRR